MPQSNGNNEEDYSLVSADIRGLLKKLVVEKGIKKFEINIKAGSMKGDNYLGIIAHALVKGQDEKGEPVEISLIVKSAPKSEGFRSMAPIRLAYEREIYMYSVVLPKFMSFQSEKCVTNPFTSFAKCLKTSFEDKDEALIMEDMKSYGFIMQNRRLPLSYPHVILVIKQLAKFHSFSFALRDQKPKLVEQLEEEMQRNFMDEIDKEQFDKHGDVIYGKALASLDPVTDAEAIIKYQKYKETINDDIIRLLQPKEAGKYAIIRHGDCWTNNFLFAYNNKENPKEPTKVCFLDWQLSCFGSPVLDILYFLYSCTDKNLRDEHFDQILKDYYQELKEFTAELGTDVEKLFPYSILLDHMKYFGRYGLAIATMLIHLMTSESEEVPDMSEVFESGNDLLEAFAFESINQKYYHTRIRDVILHQIEREYI